MKLSFSIDDLEVTKRSGAMVVVRINNALLVFSYSVCVLVAIRGKFYFSRRYWDFSRTTAKHIRMATGLFSKEIRKGLESGKFKYFDEVEGEVVL